MLYLLAIFFPWLALFLIRRPLSGAMNLVLWLLALPLTLFVGLGFWLLAGTTVHAWVLIHAAAKPQTSMLNNRGR